MTNPFLLLGKESVRQIEKALDAAMESNEGRIVHVVTNDIGKIDQQQVLLKLARLGGARDALDNLKTLTYDALSQGGT